MLPQPASQPLCERWVPWELGQPPSWPPCYRPRPPPGAAPSTVRVLTNDGEEFPVLRRLLLPCIALTKVLRPAEANASWAHVDIDTSTFDRWGLRGRLELDACMLWGAGAAGGAL